MGEKKILKLGYFYLFCACLLVIMALPKNVYAHPGKTDSSGGHYCWTNCEKYGLKYGEYHYHNNGTTNNGTTKEPIQTETHTYEDGLSDAYNKWKEVFYQDFKNGDEPYLVEEITYTNYNKDYENGFNAGIDKAYTEAKAQVESEEDAEIERQEELETVSTKFGEEDAIKDFKQNLKMDANRGYVKTLDHFNYVQAYQTKWYELESEKKAKETNEKKQKKDATFSIVYVIALLSTIPILFFVIKFFENRKK